MTGANAVPFQIGNRGDQRADSWRGLIDEVYLFDHALTDAEIAALMTAAALLGDPSSGNVPEACPILLVLSAVVSMVLRRARFERYDLQHY
jgi:hypothetical protein